MITRKFPRLAFVDLETTGGSATEDRITEVGIIEVDEDGVREWSSLINPEVRIPGFIQSLTGISDAMVRQAPTFAEAAAEVAARLNGRLFIAHNARFDYGFLKNAFRRLGRDFQPPVLCTVRLSRQLFPGFARHGLDALAERHRLQATSRHRALGDARLIWQFWRCLHDEHKAEAIEEAVSRLISRPTLPPRLDSLRIERIPQAHGVYLFYGENELPLYIGKANKLRRRVLQHFSGDHISSREQELSQQVERIDWRETAGEIGALLQEAMLVKTLMPAHNKLLRDNREIRSWRLLRRQGRLQPCLADADDLFFPYDPNLYGLFGSARKAGDALRAAAEEHALCPVVLGLEKGWAGRGGSGGRPCFACQVGKCRGACAGRETLEAHDARLLAALAAWRLQPWPYAGPIGIREQGMLHVVDGWSYLGSSASEQKTAALLRKGRPRFDKDVYRILQKRLPALEGQVAVL